MKDYKEFQSELFNEFPQEDNRRRRVFKNVPGAKKIKIVISQEKLIFFIISVILLYAIIFSVGIERGKRIKKEPVFKGEEAACQPDNREYAPTKEEPTKVIPEEKKISTYGRFYTIQIVTYTSKAQAQEELDKLKKDNYDAFMSISGKYNMIFIGKFKDKKSADNMQKKLQTKYKDCFLKDLLIEE